MIESHDIVVRANNYKIIGPATGYRTDVHYSFYGSSIKKTAEDLRSDGVKLCLCKCPNAHAIKSDWHERHGQMIGVDFRPHYRRRSGFWFCDTYIPEVEDFLMPFNALGQHVPTTGFAAIFDIMSFEPKSVYLTGFDFFKSKVHNVDEKWREGNPADPIGHAPEAEIDWLKRNWSDRMSCDSRLKEIMA